MEQPPTRKAMEPLAPRDMKPKRKSSIDYSEGKNSSTIGIKYTYTVMFLESFDFTCQKRNICVCLL